MFVTCHISFWQLSNFVGGSLEVTRTIRNNKQHFTWGCSILLLKKSKRALRPDFFLIYFPSWSLFSKCFSWFFYLAVHRGAGIFSWLFLFFTPPLARDPLSPSPRAYLRLTEKGWKIAPVLQNQASSMKLIVHGFLFLGFLHIKTYGKNKFFFNNHINIQIRRFFSELVESKSLGKYCLIMIRIGMNTAVLALSLGM